MSTAPLTPSILAQLLVQRGPSPDRLAPILVSDSPCKKDPSEWLPHLGLYMSDQDVIVEKKWLTSNVVHAAQLLLKKQSEQSKIHGWMDTQCSRRKDLFPAVPPNSHFIQILHVNESHWITISNVGKGARNMVYIYDSMSPSSVPLDLQLVICSILKPQTRTVSFGVVDVLSQTNGVDCGLYAIAFATDLVHGEDPVNSHFDSTTTYSLDLRKVT